MKVIYKDAECELVQEVGDRLVVVNYHGKNILAKREDIAAPGDETPKNKRRGGRKAQDVQKKATSQTKPKAEAEE